MPKAKTTKLVKAAPKKVVEKVEKPKVVKPVVKKKVEPVLITEKTVILNGKEVIEVTDLKQGITYFK